jgi:glycosyltransferase involved in cell wall biosynthesis
MLQPKISIVTASYNQGAFIEETIQSLLNQNYPELEYIVVDGKSSDQTVEILKKYSFFISEWYSEPDEGAADAIRKGRNRCSGELFNWLNSDDYLLPGTLLSLGAIASKFPQFDVYAFIGVGAGVKGPLMSYFGFWPKMNFHLLSCRSPFGQESTFVRMKFIIENSIEINKKFSNMFDVAFYEEILAKGGKVLFINAFGGVIRHHSAAKTTIGVPVTDYLLLGDWERKHFSFRQRIWRRLNKTRLNKLQRYLCDQPFFRHLLYCALGFPKREIFICNFVGGDCDLEESWEISKA